MEKAKRGLALTLFAIAFGLLAISDLTKPFGLIRRIVKDATENCRILVSPARAASRQGNFLL